ncbi:MAG TPA: IS1595 family transposase [Candidatus Acidoferrales bacterium]|nr:IS1595 family transposase [Candidatus Acidoferrales bacterium]
MNLIDVTRQFASKDACLDYLAAMRWPDGNITCMKCGVEGKEFRQFTTNETERKRFSAKKQKMVTVKVPSRRLIECKGCGYQFSPTAGTVFHDSHLPLEKWFMAIALILEAKKGISALQVGRHLGISQANYRTVWHLCHRIREAMQETAELKGIVEADETYIGPRVPRKGFPKRKKQGKDVVLGMVERGGNLRLVPVTDAKITSLRPVLEKNISQHVQTIMTDEHAIYPFALQRKFSAKKHQTIKHKYEYVNGPIHTNTIENAFSLLKKGVYGTFHKVSIKHLGRYCNEFSYRFNRRERQPGMFNETVKGLLRGKALPLKTLTA